MHKPQMHQHTQKLLSQLWAKFAGKHVCASSDSHNSCSADSLCCPCCLLLSCCLQYTCKYTITVVNKATGAAIPSATIFGQWTSKLTATNWPYNAQSSPTSTVGSVTITSSKTLSGSSGNGCTYTVTSISKAGYTLDPASMRVAPATLSW
jgi:hypothetical protein